MNKRFSKRAIIPIFLSFILPFTSSHLAAEGIPTEELTVELIRKLVKLQQSVCGIVKDDVEVVATAYHKEGYPKESFEEYLELVKANLKKEFTKAQAEFFIDQLEDGVKYVFFYPSKFGSDNESIESAISSAAHSSYVFCTGKGNEISKIFAEYIEQIELP